ncbi:uncharacterized protein LOC122848102 [Aphidius gifuensis]|uniref:uncharacterized protein LOC122848102 n=1 Tax=Aphidius gifuensis TaxID=684658 RepID=UPI001CDBD043|nr:uncharacterized protein LOC122848102 [Aphidius gifuensis]
MPVIAEHCKNLTTLEFALLEYGDDNTHRFVEAFTQLEQLKVVKIHLSGFGFQLYMLNSLPKDINEIHLFFRPFEAAKALGLDTMQWLMLVSTSKKNSVTPSRFSLRKFTNLRSLTIRSYDITDIIQEISKKTTLVYLNLERSICTNEIFTFNQLLNLEHLNIKDVSFKDSQSENIPSLLSGIFNSCKNLKHLDAPDFHVDLAEINMENWVNLKNLVYLNIRWQASDAIIKKIIKYCNNLEFINTYTFNSEFIIKLTKLENLNFLKFDDMTNSFNKEVMVAILNNCKKLKHLVISGFHIEEASILNDLSKLQYIESLNLAFCWSIENSAIIAIAKNCKLLKCLNIEGCSITSSAYIALTSLKNLKELHVQSNYKVKDNFIVKLRGIKSLNCSGCEKLTNAGVIQFIKNNPDLEFLNISDTKITINTIVAADEVSKNRTNNTFLSIKTNNPDLRKACIKSQWLIYC